MANQNGGSWRKRNQLKVWRQPINVKAQSKATMANGVMKLSSGLGGVMA
jgi:hypothetical protein